MKRAVNSCYPDKFILDACCGGRMCWFDKNNKNVLFCDIRTLEKGSVKNRPEFCVSPDKVEDFTKMSFSDKSFKLVLFDPPHLKNLGKTSVLAQKYGVIDSYHEIAKGFKECWRVLEDYGILVFKWADRDMNVNQMIKLFKKEPLFGHTSGSKSHTHWMCFMKIPEVNQ